jgi:NADP-dependent 3-hydroxy acid dehydrogenase YdfG
MSTAQTTGRVAVITGASSGIGEATARALAADGHSVALLARRGERIQALASELGNGAIDIEADVTDRDSIVAPAERVQQELGAASSVGLARPAAAQSASTAPNSSAIARS